MRILQVIDRLDFGGAERVFVDISNLLYENGNEVQMLFLLDKNETLFSINSNIKVYELKRTSKWSVTHIIRCGLKLKDYDIIHCHQRHVYKYVRLCSLIVSNNAKVLLHDHYGSIDIDHNVPLSLAFLFKPKYYIGVSESLCKWARVELKLKSRSVFLLSNIVRKPKLELHEKKYDLVLVSNIKPIKNQLFAIVLAKKLKRKLLIIGTVQDESYWKEIQVATDEKLIEFIHGVENISDYLQKSNIGLHVSKSESGPLVLIEYLANRLPFVSFKTGDVVRKIASSFPDSVLDDFDIDKWCEKIKLAEECDLEQLEHKYHKLFNEKQYIEECLNIYYTIANY
jgi:glycosyltransferase involved in cell wall biosynthesis